MHATVLMLAGFAGLAVLLTITDFRAVKSWRMPPSERHGTPDNGGNNDGDGKGDRERGNDEPR